MGLDSWALGLGARALGLGPWALVPWVLNVGSWAMGLVLGCLGSAGFRFLAFRWGPCPWLPAVCGFGALGCLGFSGFGALGFILSRGHGSLSLPVTQVGRKTTKCDNANLHDSALPAGQVVHRRHRSFSRCEVPT